MLTPTERIKTEQREKKELRQIFKHLLSLDIVAMSFINFIASARRTSAMNFLTPIRILCCINYVIAGGVGKFALNVSQSGSSSLLTQLSQIAFTR